MVEEIRQGDKVILSSEDGFPVAMIFNNLCGKNFSGDTYRDYIKYVALSQHGIEAGHRLLLSGRNAVQDLHNPEFLKCKTKLKIDRYGDDDNSPGGSLPP